MLIIGCEFVKTTLNTYFGRNFEKFDENKFALVISIL